MRIYDPRVGRFLSVDPLTQSYPWYSPFQFAGNKPIKFLDRDGQEEDDGDMDEELEKASPEEVKKERANEELKKLDFEVAERDFEEALKKVREDEIKKSEELRKQINKNNRPGERKLSLPGDFKDKWNEYWDQLPKRAEETFNDPEKGYYNALLDKANADINQAYQLQLAKVTGEVFYRTMSESDFLSFSKTGKIPGTSETFISPSERYVQKYNGVTVAFVVRPGTLKLLENIGVRDKSNLTQTLYPSMPMVPTGWKTTNAYFKTESDMFNKPVINIGLGTGAALDIFNSNIQNFILIKK